MKVYENSNINSTNPFYPLLQVKHLEWQRLNCTVLEIVNYLQNYSSIVNKPDCVLFSSDVFVQINKIFISSLLSIDSKVNQKR